MSVRWREWTTDGDYVDELLDSVDASWAQTLVWYLRELEVVGHGLRGLTVPELEDVVASSPSGLRVSWDELVELLRGAEDVRDLLATGHPSAVDVVLDPARATYEGCVAVVEVFDSGPFRVGRDTSAPA